MVMAMVWTLEQNENLLKALGNFPSTCIFNQIYHKFKQEPFAAFHTEGQLHVHFLGTNRRNYQKKQKKSILFKHFELIKLLSIAETLLLLTAAWKIKCSGALASLETGVLGGEAEERFQAIQCFCCTTCTLVPGLCTHVFSLKYEHYKIHKIWGL